MIDLCVDVTPEQLAYAAGMVDADGCITIAKNGPRGRAKSVTHYALVTVTNTSPSIMEWLVRYIGGAYSNRTAGTRSQARHIEKGWKDRLEWRVTGSRAIEFLALILPYLVVKREQALTVMRLEETRFHGNCRAGEVLSKETMGQRQSLLEEIRRLNKKGRA